MKNTILSSFCESIVWHRIYIHFEDTYCCSIILPAINIWEYNFLWLDLQLLLVTPFPTLERQELPCLPQPEFTSCWTGDCYIKRKSIDTCWVLGQVVGLTESREQSNIFQNSGRLWVHDSLKPCIAFRITSIMSMYAYNHNPLKPNIKIMGRFKLILITDFILRVPSIDSRDNAGLRLSEISGNISLTEAEFAYPTRFAKIV